MKHIATLSKKTPVNAAMWQDIVCSITTILADLIEAMGGSSPLVTWIDDKCAIPTPNE